MSGGIASQDFRDGAATGAAKLAQRIQTLASWDVRVTSDLVASIAEGIQHEMGGTAFAEPGPSDLWDEGFTACASEFTHQRNDPTYPIHRLNPYRGGTDV